LEKETVKPELMKIAATYDHDSPKFYRFIIDAGQKMDSENLTEKLIPSKI
jgi:hypothetical protein